MTLYIVYDDDTEVTWDLGERVPDFPKDPLTIVSVAASGVELDHIINHFTDIPKVYKGYYVRWYGDHARFIVANLPRPPVRVRNPL